MFHVHGMLHLSFPGWNFPFFCIRDKTRSQACRRSRWHVPFHHFESVLVNVLLALVVLVCGDGEGQRQPKKKRRTTKRRREGTVQQTNGVRPCHNLVSCFR